MNALAVAARRSALAAVRPRLAVTLRNPVAFSSHKVATKQNPKDFALPVHLNPVSKKDYPSFVEYWVQYFKTAGDEIDLERGLNNCFEFDWCPDVAVLEEALRATRRLNSFPTAIRTLEAVRTKTTDKQYAEVIAALKPLTTELGVPEVSELGEFTVVRSHNVWTD